MADQTPAGEREGSPGAREDFRRRIEGGPDAGGSERDFGAPVESEVPLKNHNVKRIKANNMQVGVPVHAVDHNKARHEEGHEARFRFPTPVGWGHGVYNDTGTNKFPPNYHGKANNIDASGGIFTEQNVSFKCRRNNIEGLLGELGREGGLWTLRIGCEHSTSPGKRENQRCLGFAASTF